MKIAIWTGWLFVVALLTVCACGSQLGEEKKQEDSKEEILDERQRQIGIFFYDFANLRPVFDLTGDGSFKYF